MEKTPVGHVANVPDGNPGTLETCPTPDAPWGDSSIAVLVSGGLDSAILLGEALHHCKAVYPLNIRSGLNWETDERRYLRRFLKALRCPALQPLRSLALPVKDLYGDHWSVTGHAVPGADTPDEAVFLPGRNVLLLAKALLWCHLHEVSAVALALLESNPFPDATPAFFGLFAKAVNEAMDVERNGKPTHAGVQIRVPFAGMSKVEVLRLGSSLPLEHTFSCIHPVAGKHCGVCNKCAERQRAFADAGVHDPTLYQTSEVFKTSEIKSKRGLTPLNLGGQSPF